MEKQLEYWKNKSIDKEKMEFLFKNSPFRISKYVIKNENVELICGWHPKRYRASIFLIFLKKIVKVYNNLDCVIYISDSDRSFDQMAVDILYNPQYFDKFPEMRHVLPLLDNLKKYFDIKNISDIYSNNYPFFCIYKNINSNNICIPGPFFLRNYKIWGRGEIKSLYNVIISSNKQKKMNDKIKLAVFSGRDKYKKYNELEKKNKYVTTTPKRNMYEQLKYKFLIGTYSRWDTIYWQLLSNSITLIDEKTKYILFYYYYVKPKIHYLPYNNDNNTIDNIIEKYDNDLILNNISNNSIELMKKLSYENIFHDFGKLLVEYNKIYNN